MLPNFKKMSVLTMIGLSVALSACTKKMPYQTEYKEEVQAKFDISGEYLYSASMQNASRSSQDALPFSSSENKRVKLNWSENALVIMEMEKDARFRDNTTNNKMVLEIPVEHVAYECAKDAYGKCTAKEQEKTDTTWDKKGSFKIKKEGFKSGELDLLPIMISQTIGENCYTEISSRMLSSKIEADAINFRVERTFKTNIDCLGQIESLSDATVTAVFHYSLVKLDSILSKGFKTVQYPSKDENTFGMFSTQLNVLDVDNNNIEPNHKTIMNHWNPARTSINYYLSDEFNKPENAKIKSLTHETVARINEGLVESGAKFKINLQDGKGRVPGDIRNSMIVLVEDPVASSVIGYGPQTEDPVTGEIISARTIMFLGTIKKYIKYTYDDILRAKAAQAAKAKGLAVGLTLSPQLQLRADAHHQRLAEAAKGSVAVDKADGKVDARKIKKNAATHTGGAASALKDIKLAVLDARNTKKFVNRELMSQDRKSQLKFMMEAKNCAFAPGADEMSAGVSEQLMSKFPADAKAWELLTDSEKQKVMDIILPEIWVPTLIHEIGHNLGLRHNFEASKDKENFYDFTAEQSVYSKHGIDSAKPFSSVMDYGNDLKMLPIMGKYDIAALRFAYARKVEVVDEATKQVSMVSVPSTLTELNLAQGQSLKAYGFCTDDHVGSNPGCERFDEGSSLLEIAQNHIKDYEEGYKTRNFRRGKVNMSLYEEHVYASRLQGIFNNLRMNAERYELLVNRIGEDHPAWKSQDWLVDLKAAAVLSGQFLVKVLKTPALSCAIAAKATPNQIQQIIPITELDQDALSCFEVELNPNFIVVAQTGKLINSKKDPNSTNAYMDQIDVRGIWSDKVMALRTLLKRQINVFNVDKFNDNYADIAEVQGPLVDTTVSMMLNSLVADQVFETANGQQVTLTVATDVFNSHIITKQIHPVISKILGIPHRDVYIQELVAAEVVKEMQSTIDKVDSGKPFADAFRVAKYSSLNDDGVANKPGVVKQTLGDETAYALPSNLIALEAINSGRTAAVIEAISQEEFLAVLNAKIKNQAATAPAEATDAVKAVYALDFEILKAYYLGELQGSSFYVKVLELLPNAR